MATVVLFHHVHGLTPGVEAFADRWRSAGHHVEVPDLYDGRTFVRMEDGLACAKQIGFDVLQERAVAAAPPEPVVVAGMSLGCMGAMAVAAEYGACGAVLLHGFVDPADWPTLPNTLPLEIHAMSGDEFWLEDAEIAQAYVAEHPEAAIHLYDGDAHLFTDSSLPVYDSAATHLVVERTLAFLEQRGN